MSNEIESRAKKSAYNILFSVISQSILMVTGFVLPQIILSFLGSEINGFLSSVNQIFTYLDLLRAGIGMAAMQALYKPLKEKDEDEISKILSSSKAYFNRMGLVYFACVVIVAAGFMLWGNIGIAPIQVFLCVLFQGLTGCLSFSCIGYFTDLLRAEGRNYIILVIQTGGTILTQVLEIVVLAVTGNVVAMRAMTTDVMAIEVVLFRAYRKKNYRWLDLKKKPDYSKLKNRYSYLIFHITSLICTSTDTVVISFFCGFKMASVYAVYNLITYAVNCIINTVYSSTSFLLGQSYQDGLKEFTKTHDTYFFAYTTLTASLFTVCSVLMKPFISIYTASVDDIQYIYPGLAMLFCVIQLLTSCKNVGDITINVGGYARNVVWRAILEASINLGVSIVLVNFIGIYGALIGTIVALSYRLIDVMWFSNRMVLKRSMKKNASLLLRNLILFFVISFGSDLMNLPIKSYFEFFPIAVVVAVLVLFLFFAINALFNREDINVLIRLIRREVNKRRVRR